jgi:hypothetical protein
MADLGSFDAPARKDAPKHSITVCGEEFEVHPKFSALQSVQWAKAIKRDDGMAIGAYTGDIISGSMSNETYEKFEKIVEAHEVDLTTLAQIADALMTAAMAPEEDEAADERPTTKPSVSSHTRRTTSKKSKGASSLQDKREEQLRKKGMVPVGESQYLRSGT